MARKSRIVVSDSQFVAAMVKATSLANLASLTGQASGTCANRRSQLLEKFPSLAARCPVWTDGRSGDKIESEAELLALLDSLENAIIDNGEDIEFGEVGEAGEMEEAGETGETLPPAGWESVGTDTE